MNDSILLTIKKLLGLAEDYEVFDIDVIVHINAAFLTLNDLGVGPTSPFVITDKNQTWSDFLGEGNNDYESVKAYLYLKTRLAFDPPGTSFAIEAMKKQAEEYEWRLNVRAEGSTDFNRPVGNLSIEVDKDNPGLAILTGPSGLLLKDPNGV